MPRATTPPRWQSSRWATKWSSQLVCPSRAGMKGTAVSTRFDRNIRFFGEEGQNRLRNTRVTVVGAGGVGGHVIQQLALLGVGTITVIDKEELDETNRNRYITA